MQYETDGLCAARFILVTIIENESNKQFKSSHFPLPSVSLLHICFSAPCWLVLFLSYFVIHFKEFSLCAGLVESGGE